MTYYYLLLFDYKIRLEKTPISIIISTYPSTVLSLLQNVMNQNQIVLNAHKTIKHIIKCISKIIFQDNL